MPSYPYSLTITNPGAETGDTTGWTDVSGTMIAADDTHGSGTDPIAGSYMFHMGTVAAPEAYQDIAVPAEIQSDIDGGSYRALAFGYHAGWSNDADKGRLKLTFLDGSASSLGTAEMPDETNGTNDWRERYLSVEIPANTRTIRLHIMGTRVSGSVCNSAWDELRLSVLAPETSSAPSVPTTKTGLDLWLSARTLTGGDLTSTWEDQSGNGNDVTAAGTGRPQALSGGPASLNHRPAVYADGKANVLSASGVGAYSGNTGLTIFAVVDAMRGSDLFGPIIARDGGTSNRGWALGVNQDGSPFLVISSSSSARIKRDGGTVSVKGVPAVIRGRYNGSTGEMSLWINGVQDDGDIDGSVPATIGGNGPDLQIFTNGFGNFWKGYASEILLYDNALSDEDCEAIEAELMSAAQYDVPQFTLQSTSPDIDAHQGVAGDGTHFYTFDNAAIKKHDSDWSVDTTNSSPRSGLPADVNKLNDGAVYNGVAYVRGNGFPTQSADQYILEYDTSDLARTDETVVDLSPNWGSSIAIDGANDKMWLGIWAADGSSPLVTSVNQQIQLRSLADFSLTSTLELSELLPWLQGLAYNPDDGHLYASTSGNTERLWRGTIWKVNPTTGLVRPVYRRILASPDETSQGMDFVGGTLYLLIDYGTSEEVLAFGMDAGGATGPTADTITATATGPTTIDVGITENDASVTGRTLHRSTSSGFAPGAGNEIADLGADPSSPYEDSGLDPSTTYYYVTVATNGDGSTTSNEASATTDAAGPAPHVVAAETGATTASTVVTDESDGFVALNYQIRLVKNAGAVVIEDDTVAAPGDDSDTQIDYTGLDTTTLYYVEARAQYAAGWSQWGDRVFFTTSTLPAFDATGFSAPAPMADVAGNTVFTWDSLQSGEVPTLYVSDDYGATFTNFVLSADALTHTVDLTSFTDGAGGVAKVVGDLGTEYEHVGFIINNAGTLDHYDTRDDDTADSLPDLYESFYNTARKWARFGNFSVAFESDLSAGLLAPKAIPSCSGVDAAVGFTIGGGEGGRSWEKYWDTENTLAGVGVVGRGTVAGEDIVGVTASVKTAQVWPLDPAGAPCTSRGTDGNARLEVNIGASGVGGFGYNGFTGGTQFEVTLPTRFFVVARGCNRWPRYQVRLRVTHPDVINFPERIRVQAAVRGPNLRYVLDAEDYWQIDEVVDVGAEFDCGVVGYLSMSAGAQANHKYSFTEFQWLSATVLEENCDTTPEGETPNEEIPPGKPCAVLLQVYEEDRATIAWQATDDPHYPLAEPYLGVPEHYGEQEIDPVECRASIGTVTATVIDPPLTTGDQDTGYMVHKLADNFAISAVHGRRCRLLRYINEQLGWVVIADGPGGGSRMDPSYAAFATAIRDTRESERKSAAFVSGSMQTYPVGSTVNYGSRDDGTFLVDKASTWIGTFLHPTPDSAILGAYILRVETFLGTYPAITDAIIERWFKALSDPRYPYLIPPVYLEWKGTAEPAGDPWRRMDVIFQTWWQRASGPYLTLPEGTEDPFKPARFLLAPAPGTPAENIPGDGAPIFFRWRSAESPSAENPFVYEGTLGALLKDLYDGVYSERDEDGNTISTGIRYDPDALALMTEVVRLRIDERVKDLRKWTEKHLYAPAGYLPRLDNDGRISPVKQDVPADTSGLVQITEQIAEPGATWAHDERIVNQIIMTAYRDYLSDDAEALDGVATRDIEFRYESRGSVNRHGEQPVELDALAFRAIGDAFANPIVDEEIAQALAAERRDALLPRFRYGQPTFTLKCMRVPTALVKAGDWVRVTLGWMPSYASRTRGLTGFIMQVISVRDLDCAWREFTFQGGARYSPSFASFVGAGDDDDSTWAAGSQGFASTVSEAGAASGDFSIDE